MRLRFLIVLIVSQKASKRYHHIDMEMTRLSNMQSRSTSFFLLLKKGGEGETYVHIVFPQIFHVFSKLSQIASHLIPYPCPKALLL
jgi:hypothetical protein